MCCTGPVDGIDEVACEKSTCRAEDYFPRCPAGKVCNSGGCYDCPSGSHYCPRDQGFWLNACPNDKQCHSTGCITGTNQELYLAEKQMCCTSTADGNGILISLHLA